MLARQPSSCTTSQPVLTGPFTAGLTGCYSTSGKEIVLLFQAGQKSCSERMLFVARQFVLPSPVLFNQAQGAHHLVVSTLCLNNSVKHDAFTCAYRLVKPSDRHGNDTLAMVVCLVFSVEFYFFSLRTLTFALFHSFLFFLSLLLAVCHPFFSTPSVSFSVSPPPLTLH